LNEYTQISVTARNGIIPDLPRIGTQYCYRRIILMYISNCVGYKQKTTTTSNKWYKNKECKLQIRTATNFSGWNTDIIHRWKTALPL